MSAHDGGRVPAGDASGSANGGATPSSAGDDARDPASALAVVADRDPAGLVVSSLGFGWRGIAVARFRHRVDRVELPPLPCHLAMVHLGQSATVGGRLGRLLRRSKAAAGAVTIVPAGLPTAWSFDRPGVDALHLYLAPAVVNRLVGGAGFGAPTIDLFERFAIREPEIERLGRDLLREAEAPDHASSAVAMALADLLAARLVRRHAAAVPGTAAASPAPPTGLPDAALLRVLDHIDRNLAADLSVAALAALVGVSAAHFGRLFRRATGHSPHEFVVRRRVERAADLLRAGGRSIADVACAVGFADQSHLTRHFGRLVGATPARFLRDRAILPNPRAILQDPVR